MYASKAKSNRNFLNGVAQYFGVKKEFKKKLKGNNCATFPLFEHCEFLSE